jgi:adenosine kinase
MSEARQIELAPLTAQQPIDLVLIGPNDPEAMLRHTEESRARGLPFAADPSQQLAWSDGPQIKALVDGAAYLFSNDYEAALISSKTGWSGADVLARVGVRITTHGKDGTVIEQEGEPAVRVPVLPAHAVVDPTGVGDAFRAGFLAGLAWGLSHERCAQVGSLLATHVLETVGTQEYRLERGGALARFADAYGDEAASEVAGRLAGAVPA